MSNPNQPPGSFPPGAYPPGAYPPGAYPPGAYPPGAYPPGAFPPGAFPPGAFPPGALPPGSFPAPPGQPVPPGGAVYFAAYYGPVGSTPPPGSFAFPPGSYPGYPPQQPPVSPQVPHPSPAPVYTGPTPPPPPTPTVGSHKFVTFRAGRFIISGDNKGTGLSQKHVEIQVGSAGDIPVPGNYFGDGIRFAVFRPHEGKWMIKGPGLADWNSSGGNVILSCGKSGDVPVPGDYFNEGKDRIAVWRPSDGKWHIKAFGPSDWGAPGTTNYIIQHGSNGDIPVPYDYFGEKATRLAVFRPSNGKWFIKGPGVSDWGKTSGNLEIQHGCKDDIPIPFDYYREGRARLGVFRRSDGKWYIKGHQWADWGSSSGNVTLQHGAYTDTPLVGDFFGDGPRLAVFRGNEGQWHVKGVGFADWPHSNGNVSVPWGQPGDIALAVKLNI